jgi:LysR family transcriptional regulator of gallate degradation
MTSEVLVPQALSRLFAARPGTRATVVDGTYEALLHQLRHGDLDLMVGPLRGDRCPADTEERLLFIDRLLPVVRGGHPVLAGPAGRTGRGPRSLKGLLGWPWIGPLPDTPARAAFERAFVTAGLAPPAVQLQANSPSVMRAVLHNGDAVALVSPLQIRADIAAGTLVVLPLPVSGTERPIGVSLRRGGLPSPVCQALLQDLQAVSAGAGS